MKNILIHLATFNKLNELINLHPTNYRFGLFRLQVNFHHNKIKIVTGQNIVFESRRVNRPQLQS